MATRVTHAMQQVPQPPGQLLFGRAQVLAAVASQTHRLSFRERLTVEMRFAGKLLAACIVLLVMLVPLSPGIVGAARDSMPGQLFYPLKLHIERVQFQGANQPDVRVSLGLAFLGERVAETQTLAGTGRSIEYETVIDVYQLTHQILIAVAQTPEAALEDTLTYVSRQLQAYLDVLESLGETVTPSNAAYLSQITRGCRRAYLVASLALEEPGPFRSAYQEGRPELFLLPGENPLGEFPTPSNVTSSK